MMKLFDSQKMEVSVLHPFSQSHVIASWAIEIPHG